MDNLRGLIMGLCSCLLIAGCAGAVRSNERPDLPLPPSKQDCTICHINPAPGNPGTLKQGPSALCFACHADRKAPAEHQVDIIPPMAVRGLPLFEGRMTCVTCHDPHVNRFGSLLRKPEPELCLSCHPY